MIFSLLFSDATMSKLLKIAEVDDDTNYSVVDQVSVACSPLTFDGSLEVRKNYFVILADILV